MYVHTHSGKVYHPDKASMNIDPNDSSSGITSPADCLIPEILKTLEEIKTKVNILSQRIDRI